MTADFCSSSDFVSISATGSDWRSVARECVETLERVQTKGRPFTFGLVYVSEELAGDYESILTLLRSVTAVEEWHGCTALGVFAHDGVHLGLPSLSLMLGTYPDDQWTNLKQFNTVQEWLPHMPVALTHSKADDFEMDDITMHATGCYHVGGISSARHHSLISNGMRDSHDSPVGSLIFAPDAFASDFGVQVALMRGWIPLHDGLPVTSVTDNVVETIDGRPAWLVMQEVMGRAVKKGMMPDTSIPQEQRGSLHVSFPLTDADQDDDFIRNIISVDEDQGTITLAHMPQEGERLRFVYRDMHTAGADMRENLRQLSKRLYGQEITGAIYISCVARIDMLDTDWDEVKALRSELGAIPLTGFYAVGEIARSRLRGYSGILLAFTKTGESTK